MNHRYWNNTKALQRMYEGMFRITNITLKEYSRPEWFDGLGRPLTSRDSTGRFVNPWQSQSTNGIQSISSICSNSLIGHFHNKGNSM